MSPRPFLRVFVFSVSLLVACSSAETNVFFPTWEPSGGGSELAVLEGRLIVRGDCVLWATDAGEFLPIWPESYEFDGSDVVVDSQVLVTVGEGAFLVGGELSSFGEAESMTQSEIPRQCRVTGGPWRVADVTHDIGP